MTRTQEIVAFQKRINKMAQANGKKETSAMTIRITLAATTIVFAAVSIAIIVKVAGL